MLETTQPKARILFADDEDIFLKPTALFFENHGFDCDCVRTSEEAAAMLAQYPYDLLVIDINMPGNTNLEFLRDRPQVTEFLPVIVVTGNPTLNTAVESLRLAVVDYRTKPLDLPDFLQTAATAIEKAQAVRIMRNARKGFSSWLDQINQMESQFLAADKSAREKSVKNGDLNWYLGEAVQGFASLSMSLMNAIHTLNQGLPEKRNDLCRLMNCSRLSAYESGIQETVEVLKKTKNSFKSKDLADLRIKLESMIKNESAKG
jgi:DNA-binding response OmpR family regulator